MREKSGRGKHRDNTFHSSLISITNTPGLKRASWRWLCISQSAGCQAYRNEARSTVSAKLAKLPLTRIVPGKNKNYVPQKFTPKTRTQRKRVLARLAGGKPPLKETLAGDEKGGTGRIRNRTRRAKLIRNGGNDPSPGWYIQ